MDGKINRILIPLLLLILFSIGSKTIGPGQAVADDSDFPVGPNLPTGLHSQYHAFLPIISIEPTGWIGPYGGTITSVAIDPTNPQVIYAGSFGSGVFKSIDGGNSWLSANDGLANPYIYSLAIDPAQSNNLFAGTFHSQVYKSQDGGKTWTWSGSGMQDQAVVYSIAVDPTNPARVYACTRGLSTNGHEPWNGVVYRSIDAGQTWIPSLQEVGGPGLEDWAYSVAVNPNLPYQVFIATHQSGPYRSDNYGANWFAISQGINDYSGRAIVISPQVQHAGLLFYGVWHFDTIYKTLNGGGNWTLSNYNYPNVEVYSLALDPYSADTVYMATFTHGLMRSLNGGGTWNLAGLQSDQLYSIVINPFFTTNLFAGTGGDGLYRSLDSSTSWQRSINGISNANVSAVVQSPIAPNILYASVYGAGVFQSFNRGQSWHEFNNGLGDLFVHDLAMYPFNPYLLYALTDTGGLYQNDFSGAGWIRINGGLPLTQTPLPAFSPDHPFATLEMLEAFANPQPILPDNQSVSTNLLKMVYAPSNAQIAYIGTRGYGVYRSVNAGLNWQSAGLGGETIHGLAVDIMDQNIIYAATEYSGSLKTSTNGGIDWYYASLPAYFYSVIASPTETGVAYVGTDMGVYRYQSGSWTAMGLSDKAILSIAVDPFHPGVFYAGTSSGAYYSTNYGATWNDVASQLQNQVIQSIRIDLYNPNAVYFTTKTHGVYLALITL
jgi:photosystem II stability/assembly factor-like uncharacterized protein